MSDRIDRMAELAARIRADLDPRDAAGRLARIEELAIARPRRRAAAAGIGLAASAAALVFLLPSREDPPSRIAATSRPEAAARVSSVPPPGGSSAPPVSTATPTAPAPAPAAAPLAPAARADAAPARTSEPGDTRPIASVEDLLVAADVARLSDRPREAVRNLRRALALHPDRPREAVASFTLGKVLLEELGDPDSAAEAFARARSAEPRGPLAEDALAREVEGWSRAGAGSLARLRAEEYLRLYPAGRRATEVRRFGGLGG